VPVQIGAGGVERVVEVSLTAAERAQLDESVSHVRDLVAASEKFLAA
jgi:malate dehydrogenase